MWNVLLLYVCLCLWYGREVTVGYARLRGGQERGLGGLFGARLYWVAAGKQRSPHSEGCQWLLMFGGEVRGWRCTWLDWREERAWLGQAMWSEALLGSCWEAKEPAG